MFLSLFAVSETLQIDSKNCSLLTQLHLINRAFLYYNLVNFNNHDIRKHLAKKKKRKRKKEKKKKKKKKKK